MSIADLKNRTLESFIGEDMKAKGNEIYVAHALTRDIPVGKWPQICALYLKDRTLVSADIVGKTPDRIKTGQLATKAIKNDATDIILVGQFPHSGSSDGNKEHPTMTAALAAPQIKAYADISVQLSKKGITLREVTLCEATGTYRHYSNNVSRVLFPGWEPHEGFCALYEDEYRKPAAYVPGSLSGLSEPLHGICDDDNWAPDYAEGNVHLIALNKKDKAIGYGKVDVDSRKLVAPYITKRNCLFDVAMKEAVKIDAASVIIVQCKKDAIKQPLLANASDIAIFQAGREAARRFDLNVKDCLLYNGEEKGEHLSFVQSYGMH